MIPAYINLFHILIGILFLGMSYFLYNNPQNAVIVSYILLALGVVVIIAHAYLYAQKTNLI